MNIGSIGSPAALGIEREAQTVEAPQPKKPAPKGHYNVTISDEALALARGKG